MVATQSFTTILLLWPLAHGLGALPHQDDCTESSSTPSDERAESELSLNLLQSGLYVAKHERTGSVPADQKVSTIPYPVGSSIHKFPQAWETADRQSLKADREYEIYRPPKADGKTVLIIIHGSMSSRSVVKSDFNELLPKKMLESHIYVYPSGLDRKGTMNQEDTWWNVGAEPSQAPDFEFIEEIMTDMHETLGTNPRFLLIGVSNGGALVNRVLIESDDPNIAGGIPIVSQLLTVQAFSNDTGVYFKRQNGRNNESPYDGNYDDIILPVVRPILNLLGAKDDVAPNEFSIPSATEYVGPGGEFYSAKESTFIWARHQGYDGEEEAFEDVGYANRVVYPQISCYVFKDADHGLKPSKRLEAIFQTFSDAAFSR